MKMNAFLKNPALLLVAMASFLIAFMGSSLSIALPLIGKDLINNVILLGWLPTVFVLANTAFLLPFGKLADIYGRKKVFSYGLVIYTLASLMAALSPSGFFLIAGSFFQGVGSALIFATGVALLSSVYPPNRRGEMLGFFVTSVFVGLFLGPLLGGFLAQNLGWRSIFLFNVPLGLLILILITWKLKGEWSGSPGEKFDIRGSAIYIPSLIALMYGLTSLNNRTGQLIFIVGIFGIFIFLLLERRSYNPIVKLEYFKRRISAFPALAMLLINISTTALWTLLSLYLQYLLSLSPQITALILSVEPLMVALFSPLVGRLSDIMENRIFTVSGMGVTTVGLLVLSTLTINTALWTVIIGVILVGVGVALFSPPATNIFMGSMSRENYGMASATLSTMIYAGQTISLGLLLLILSNFLGNVQIAPPNFDLFIYSLKTAFTLFAVITAGGMIISLFMNKRTNLNKN